MLVLQHAGKLEIPARVVFVVRLRFTVALQEIRCERLRVRDTDDLRSEELLAVESGAFGFPACKDAGQVVIGQLPFIHELNLAVAVKEDEIFVRGRENLILSLDPCGAVGRVEVIHKFHVELWAGQLIFLDQSFDGTEQRIVGIEKDNHLYRVGERVKPLECQRREPEPLVDHPLVPFEMPARQVIHHHHQRQQRRA